MNQIFIKGYNKILKICYNLLGIILNIIIRIIRPIIHIRLGAIMSSRIGETAPFIETYLCEQENNNTRKSVDIFFLEDKICNAELIKMYSK